jgi:hypothetical protein
MQGRHRPRRTPASFQPRLKLSWMETFMPWPALGLWVWQASPAMNTHGSRAPAAPSGVSSNLSQSLWPIS